MNYKVSNTGIFENILQFVSFNIGNEEFAVDILKVQEIIKLTELTKIPNAPNFIEGIVNLRENVVPAIDLRTKLNFPKKMYDSKTRIIVITKENRTLGLIVDEVHEVLRISKRVIEPPPKIISKINLDIISGLAKLEGRLIIILNIEKIFNEEEINKLKTVKFS